MVQLRREPWVVKAEQQALSLPLMGVEAGQGHDSAAQVARFSGLQRVEARQICGQPAFLPRPLMVVGEEGVPVVPRARSPCAQACQHRRVVEAHRISVSVVTVHAEK